MKKILLFCLVIALVLCTNTYAKVAPTVMKIGADWCPPCREVKAMLKQVEKKLKAGGVRLVDVDIDKHPEIGKKYNVSLIPTIIFFDKNGKQVFKQVGAMRKQEFLDKLKELGMFK